MNKTNKTIEELESELRGYENVIADKKAIIEDLKNQIERKRVKEMNEIESHLRSKAKDEGFVIGAYVKLPSTSIKSKIIDIYFINSSNYNWHNQDCIDYFNKGHKYFLAAGLDPDYSFGYHPLAMLQLYNDDIIVKVNGVEYKAEFKGGVTVFGCAEIDNKLIRRARDLFYIIDKNSNIGNRDFDAVKIGAGLFTKEILDKLVARMIG